MREALQMAVMRRPQWIFGEKVGALITPSTVRQRKKQSDFRLEQSSGETPATVLPAEIADGVEAFGFGWDLRPWRIVRSRTDSQFRVLISPSGARHRIPNGIGTPDFVGRTLTTMDSTHYRFTVTAVDAQDRATTIEMEDGSGNLYTFSHIVPLACNVDLPHSGDPGDLIDLNFQVETSGLYLTSIERGPWINDMRDDGIAKQI